MYYKIGLDLYFGDKLLAMSILRDWFGGVFYWWCFTDLDTILIDNEKS